MRIDGILRLVSSVEVDAAPFENLGHSYENVLFFTFHLSISSLLFSHFSRASRVVTLASPYQSLSLTHCLTAASQTIRPFLNRAAEVQASAAIFSSHFPHQVFRVKIEQYEAFDPVVDVCFSLLDPVERILWLSRTSNLVCLQHSSSFVITPMPRIHALESHQGLCSPCKIITSSARII